MNVLGTLAVIFLLAFLVEALVEAVFGKVVEQVPKLKPYSWLLAYLAFAAGVAGAFVYRFDLLFLLGQWLDAPVPLTSFGMILTGLGVGRGSNFINDLVSKFFKKTSTTT